MVLRHDITAPEFSGRQRSGSGTHPSVVLRVSALFLAVSAVAPAQLRLHPVAGGLTSPTAIAAPRDGSGDLFVLEQPGRVRVIRNGVLAQTPVLTVPQLSSGGERGLLGIAFPPGYASKRYFYLNYTDTQGATVVSRWRLTAGPPSEEIVLRIPRTRSNHNGGGIVFGPDGYLYIGTGDSGGAGDPDNAAQNPMELRGKMLRIDTESGAPATYTVPPTNPFAGRTGYRPEIWAMGLRNPWRYSFDRQTGDLWIADVGQDRAEEVNFQAASSAGGENYGWHVMEGLQCFTPPSGCNRQGLTLPVQEYSHSLGISITGGFVYRGKRNPDLSGMYLYGDYGSGRIWGLRRSDGDQENRELLASGLQLSAFGEDEAGEIYVAEYRSGRIFTATTSAPVTSAKGVVNAASFGPGLVPGSLATAFGTGLSTFAGIVQATAFPLPVELAGTRVTLNGTAVPLVAVANVAGQEQINFQVPFELAGASRATLVVQANGASSEPVEVALAAVQPEIFAVTRTGDNLTIWATGLGAVSNAPATGEAARPAPLSQVAAAVGVTVGGAPVEVTFAGLAPGYSGLYQINVRAPGGGGDVVVRAGNAVSRPRPLAAP